MQDRLGLLANWKPSKFWNEAHSYHFYYEGSAEDMKDLIKTEELDILKEHTEEFWHLSQTHLALTTLRDTRMCKLRTGWYYSTCMCPSVSSSISRRAPLELAEHQS